MHWGALGCTGLCWAALESVVQVVQVVQVVRVVRMISLDNMYSENIWFAWSEPSNCQEKWRCPARDEQTDGRRTESGK